MMKKGRLLIQMWYESSTNKFPKFFPHPLLLLKIKQPEDELKDFILLCYQKTKKEKYVIIDHTLKLFNRPGLCKAYTDIILSCGEFPADANKTEFFDYWIEHAKFPYKVMGVYPTIEKDRVQKLLTAAGDYGKIIPTNFDVHDVDMSKEFLETYPQVKPKLRASMKVTYGCPRNCRHCPTSLIYHMKYKFFDREESAQRIKRYYDMGVRFITFTDDNLGVATEIFVVLMKRVKELNLKGLQFICQEGFEVSSFADEEFIKCLKEMKFVDIKLGIENINERFLEKMGKCYRDHSMVETALKNIQKYKLKVGCFFLIGLDLTKEEIMENLRFIAKHRLDVRANILRPYGGKQLIEPTVPLKEQKQLISLAYTVSFWATMFDVDIFEDQWELMLHKAKLSYNLYEGYTSGGYTGQVNGKCQYGFKTSRFKKGIQFILERDYPNHKVLLTEMEKYRMSYLLIPKVPEVNLNKFLI